MYDNKATEKSIIDFLAKSGIDYYSLSNEDKKIVIAKLIRGCHNCSLFYDTKLNSVPPIINPNSTYLFIGRNPCKTEALANEMFPKGTPVGNIFSSYLSYLDIPLNQASILNMCYCYGCGNRPPTQENINKCVAFKKFEMELVGTSYKYIFCMGNDAFRWVMGLKAPSVMSVLGSIYKLHIGDEDKIVFPLIHPNQLVIQPELKGDMAKLLKFIKKYIN